MTFEGIVGIERVGLYLDATAVDPPETAEVIPGEAIDDDRLVSVLEAAAETGRATRKIGVERTDAYLARFETLADGFAFEGAEDSETLYIDVDGTTVELVVQGFPYHADHFLGRPLLRRRARRLAVGRGWDRPARWRPARVSDRRLTPNRRTVGGHRSIRPRSIRIGLRRARRDPPDTSSYWAGRPTDPLVCQTSTYERRKSR